MAHFILVYARPDGSERRFELERGNSYRLGSHHDNDIVLRQTDVSRHHAVLKVLDSTFRITDLNSKNGTFVNGREVVSAELLCGDEIQLSSARMILVEEGSGPMAAFDGPPTPSPEARPVEVEPETTGHRKNASTEDLVTLLRATASAVAEGAVAGPLAWGVDNLGLDGALLLYRNSEGQVSVVASAGDLGRLVEEGGVLTVLAGDESFSGEAYRLREVSNENERFLVGTVRAGHLLVVRFAGESPSVSDLLALMAAVEVVVAALLVVHPARLAHSGRSQAVAPNAGLELDSLAGRTLAEARESFERWLLNRVLDQCDGRRTEAAKRLGLSRAGLFKKLRRLGITGS